MALEALWCERRDRLSVRGLRYPLKRPEGVQAAACHRRRSGAQQVSRAELTELRVDVVRILRQLQDCGTAAGTALPAAPVSVFAEDFSLLIRTPRRMRIARSRIRVLS